MSNRMTSNINPIPTQSSPGKLDILPPEKVDKRFFRLPFPLASFSRHLVPSPHIGKTTLIFGHDHFSSFSNGNPVLTASTTCASRPRLRIDQLAGTALTDWVGQI